ncbi:ribosome maturation factor RimM [Microlunatus panaciterrae]|uniref:Ribosome maturation factor RimM n=1 Tax=Microlunatus panaciterrae TaxID=400768 RepID=A0ABS2RP68_9ACTN|nr:ribosome maturation factor RimM [Microlunatus panaciterrae]MBM7800367.1 16S rRNA processing protein RimM [Microlunatus panaciterrae]
MTSTVEVIVGVIGRPHGLRGEVAIELRTDEPERRFAVGQVLSVQDEDRTLTVAARRMHNGRLLLTFAELTDRTAVEGARGLLLVARVPQDETPEDDGEYYDRQLVGLRVLDAAGREVGKVLQVVHLPAQDLLEISTAGSARLVPFVATLVPEVDLAAGLLRLAEVPGLLADEDDQVANDAGTDH